MGGSFSSYAKSALHRAAHSAPFPAVSIGGDVLTIIIQLCEMVSLNRYVSCLSQYNQINLAIGALRATSLRDVRTCALLSGSTKNCLYPSGQSNTEIMCSGQLFVPLQSILLMTCRCLNQVKDTMTRWAEKNWFYMLMRQADFKADLDGCDRGISECLLIFSVSTLYLEGMLLDDLLDGCAFGRAGAPAGRGRTEKNTGRDARCRP
jgi:hypothetical protein